jgi:nucleoside-diphosphate-sugar epimerase
MSNSPIAEQATIGPSARPLRILVAGGSRFIGRKLIIKLTDSKKGDLPSIDNEILCMTRNSECPTGSLRRKYDR